MNYSTEMSLDTLEMIIKEGIIENADRTVRDIMHRLYIQSVAENQASTEENGGAEILIRIKVPGTKECDRILNDIVLEKAGEVD